MNLADVLLLVWTLGFASLGYYRGFVAQLLSLAGLVAGAVAGSWIAPKLLADNSPWVSLAGLAGALIGAVILGSVAGAIAQTPRRFLLLRPSLRIVDGAGGAVFGGVLGLALAWLVAVVALHQPGLGMRSAVRNSALLPRLLAAVPPDAVLVALNRFDPFPELPALADAQLPPPDPSVLQDPGTRAAMASVVKVEGTACGIGAQGSGWVVRSGLVATNVHVIAGQDDTRVLTLGGQNLAAHVVYVDVANDVALLAVDSLRSAPLAADARNRFPRAVAVVGYPRNGGLTAVAATAGAPRNVIAPNAYGGHVRPRTVVPLRGGSKAEPAVQPGDSGGPLVDGRGGVVAMVFGGTEDGRGGYAVPVELVLRGTETRLRPVSSGPCLE